MLPMLKTLWESRKSFIVNCLKLLLGDKLCVCAPTGVASYNISGSTLHSLISLPTKTDFKDLDGRKLNEMQQSLLERCIDEMSMVGRKTFGQIDKRFKTNLPTQST